MILLIIINYSNAGLKLKCEFGNSPDEKRRNFDSVNEFELYRQTYFDRIE